MWPTLRDAGNPIPYELTLAGNPVVTASNPVALVGAAGAAAAQGDRFATLSLLNQADALGARFPTYYSAAWTALGRIMLTTDWLPDSCTGR